MSCQHPSISLAFSVTVYLSLARALARSSPPCTSVSHTDSLGVTQLWEYGFLWHNGAGQRYLVMISGIYVVLGFYLMMASFEPNNHQTFISFAATSSIVHGVIMGIQAAIEPDEIGHFAGGKLFVVCPSLVHLRLSKSVCRSVTDCVCVRCVRVWLLGGFFSARLSVWPSVFLICLSVSRSILSCRPVFSSATLQSLHCLTYPHTPALSHVRGCRG